MYNKLIPLTILHKAKQTNTDSVQWYIHCGDHIMARRPLCDTYVILHEFDGFSLKELNKASIIVEAHNINLLSGITDYEYNNVVAKAIKENIL